VSRPPVRSSDLSIFPPDFSKSQAKFRRQSIVTKKNFHFPGVFFSNFANKPLASESWQLHPADS